jgi:Sulfatase
MRTGTLGRLLVALAVCSVLNAALTLQNAWPSLWVEAGPGVSVELLVFLAAIALWLECRPRLGRGLAWCIAVVLFLLVVGRYFAVTAHALFGRSINLYFDLPHLPAVIAMTAEVRPVWQVVLFAVLLVAVPALLLVGLRFGIGAIARMFADRVVRRAAFGVAVAGIVGYIASMLFGAHWADRVFALPVSPVYAQQAGFLADAVTGRKDSAFLSKPAATIDPEALGRRDVFVFFLESYGEVAYSVPEIADAVRPRVAEAERRLTARGWRMASGFFTSPTFGGGSWLAHSSFLTGVPVSQNRDYQLLLSSGHASLVGAFAKAGYRTVALMPGLKLAWPEGRFYGFDEIYDAAGIGYGGKSFGWWTIPDQFTIARMLGAEQDVAGRKPLFVVFPTVMSHMPFAPVPPYLADWSRAADPAAYGAAAANQEGTLGDWKAARGAYRTAMLYNLDMVEGFIAERAPPGALVVVLGDHQPPGVVSGPGAGWLVPVHVFSRDEGRIARFVAAGFRPGLTPKGATLGDFAALHHKFATGLQ